MWACLRVYVARASSNLPESEVEVGGGGAGEEGGGLDIRFKYTIDS